MANYPSFAQMQGSVPVPRDDMKVDYATDGTPQQRSFYAALKYDFRIKHKLSAADKATLDSFYTTNRLLQVTFVWAGDGSSHTCYFKGPPIPVWDQNWYNVDVGLAEI